MKIFKATIMLIVASMVMSLSACIGCDGNGCKVRIYCIGRYENDIGMQVDIDEENERFVIVEKNIWGKKYNYLLSFRFKFDFSDYPKSFDEYLDDYYNEYWDDSLSEEENSALEYDHRYKNEFEYTDENGDIVELDEDGVYNFYGDKTFYVSYKNANENLKKAIEEGIREKTIRLYVSGKHFEFYD